MPAHLSRSRWGFLWLSVADRLFHQQRPLLWRVKDGPRLRGYQMHLRASGLQGKTSRLPGSQPAQKRVHIRRVKTTIDHG